MAGRSAHDIVSQVGPPNSRSDNGDGTYLLQWMATGYHIALLFDGQGTCLGVTHEFAGG